MHERHEKSSHTTCESLAKNEKVMWTPQMFPQEQIRLRTEGASPETQMMWLKLPGETTRDGCMIQKQMSIVNGVDAYPGKR
jgi:hypothetical protein